MIRTIAFIFARGGSKGLPGKNIKRLCGKPLIAYSIEAALQAPSIDDVYVSTEDKEIAEVASLYGAKVISRPAELAQDDTPEWLAWRHALTYVTEKHGDFTHFVSLPATSPLRNVTDVENAVKKLNSTKADICISITPASRSPYFNMVRKNDKGLVELVNKPSSSISHRQNAPEIFDITTVVYAATVNFILDYNSLFDGDVTYILVPKERAVDIDDIYDFMLAEAILNG